MSWPATTKRTCRHLPERTSTNEGLKQFQSVPSREKARKSTKAAVFIQCSGHDST